MVHLIYFFFRSTGKGLLYLIYRVNVHLVELSKAFIWEALAVN